MNSNQHSIKQKQISIKRMSAANEQSVPINLNYPLYMNHPQNY